MNGITQLLTVARTYGAATGLTLSAVSWRALGDTKKLSALEDGADITVGRLEGALQWFSDNWPEDEVCWPSGVLRPSARAEARS